MQKGSLLDYLPLQQKQRVLQLVRRLQQQTDLKQKYLSMYTEIKQAHDELLKKYSLLKDQNQYLKKQIHNSFSIVSQVRANFTASSKKIRKQNQQEWQDDDSNQQQQNKLMSANKTKDSILNKLQKYRPPSSKKQKNKEELDKNNNQVLQKSYLNQSLNSCRSQEALRLKKQIRQLQQQKKQKQNKQKALNQKTRLVQQIKERYKSSKNKQKSRNQSPQSVEEVQIQKQTKMVSNVQIKQPSVQPTIVTSTLNIDKTPIKQTNNQISKIQSTKPKNDKFIVTSQDYSDILDLINKSTIL